MDQFSQTNIAQSYQPASIRTSGLAIASFIMGLLGMIVCVLWPLLGLPAIICGIIALVKISGSGGTLKGKGYAIAGIVLAAIMAVLLPALGMLIAVSVPAAKKAFTAQQLILCESNERQLSMALIAYANDSSGLLPAENWMDALKEKGHLGDQAVFVCPHFDGKMFYYALNKNITNLNEVSDPARTVLIFEADLKTGDTGGPEDMVFPHKQDVSEGCNVGFVDGHVEFVTRENAENLHWTMDAP